MSTQAPHELSEVSQKSYTSPQPMCCVQSSACRGKTLTSEEAFVPSVDWLFRKIRNTTRDPKFPLTVAEVLPFVRCTFHSGGLLGTLYNGRQGISEMYPLIKTLELMDRWYDVIQDKTRRWLDRMEKKELRRVTRQPAPPPKPKNFGTPTAAAPPLPKPGSDKKKGRTKKSV